jgi:hypothetical protein
MTVKWWIHLRNLYKYIMSIEFNETNQWFASSDEKSNKMMGPFGSKEDAIKEYASKLSKNSSLAPFYVHTKTETLVEVDFESFMDWLLEPAVSMGIGPLDYFEKIENNPKVARQLADDLNGSLLKALASVQGTNKVTQLESYRVYPREFIKYTK